MLFRFLRHGLWETDLNRGSRGRRFGLGLLRVTLYVARSFSRSLMGLQAAGLTLVTLLAMVPLLALVFTVAKMAGYADKLELWLHEIGRQLPEQGQGAVEHVRLLVAEVNFGALGVIGTIAVVWSALALFTRVEQALNSVWRAHRDRSFLRRFVSFVAVVVLVPPLATAALLLSSLLRGVHLIRGLRDQAEWLAWLYQAGLGFLPYVMLSISLTALYKLMPPTRVRWRCALVGGVAAGSALIVLHGIYLGFQVGVAQANAIYATLAALPLLLIYLELLWTVVLAGAEVSYAVQNLSSLRHPHQLPRPAYGMRVRTMWHLMRAAIDAVQKGSVGIGLSEFATRMDLPLSWVDDAADLLVDAGLLRPGAAEYDILAPGRPPGQIHVSDLLVAIEGRGKGQVRRVALPEPIELRLNTALDGAAHAVADVGF